METSLDLSRWREAPRGVGYRQWTIVSAGLRQIFRTRFFRLIAALAWMAGLMIAGVSLLFSQTLASGGWFEQLASNFGPRGEAVSAAVGAFVLLYPDICIHGIFTAIFWLHSFFGLWFSLIALTILVPQLITRDRASNAMTVYLSRPLTSTDYLLGKLGVIAGVLVVLWTGPLLAGWLLSLLVAPNTDFIVYSLEPLLRALVFHGISLVSLAAIALGVSALGRAARITVVIWLGLWLIASFLATPPRQATWIKRASFTVNLSQVRQEVFNLDQALKDAATKLPLLNREFADNLNEASREAEASDARGALLALAGFVVFSSFIFLRRIRAE